jgi:RHS repeat-associated protein
MGIVIGLLRCPFSWNGNLVKSVESDATVYSYQGLDILYEKDTATGTVTKHFYAGALQVAKMVGTTKYYLHADALGSTRLVMTSTPSVQFSSNYRPYGLTYSMTGSETFKYTGKMYDGVTGLYYFNARWYDPSTGRFVTQDSITGTQEDPMSLDRYMYARDNPMKIVDLAGHEWWNPISDITSAASAVTSTVTSVASAVTNEWNSLPPTEQEAIVVGVAVVATAATAGLAAPIVAPAAAGAISSIAIGAAVSSTVSLGIGIYQGNASPDRVLTSAALGTIGGGFSVAADALVAGMAAQAAVGAGTSLLSQQVNSVESTGQLTTPSLSVALAGGFFGASGAALDSLIGGYWGDTARTSLVSTSSVSVAQGLFSAFYGIPQVTYPIDRFIE